MVRRDRLQAPVSSRRAGAACCKDHGDRTIQPPRSRTPLAGPLGRGPHFRDQKRRSAAEILRARDVPLPLGAHPHGPCAQLYARRRRRPLHARQGLQRALPQGLGRLRPAGRERGDAEWGESAHLDLRQHRGHARAAQGDGPVARLEPRVRHLRPGILRPAAEAVRRLLSQGPRLPEEVEGQLGPGRPDGARQRAGDRRPRLALGRHRRAARAGAVVLPHHRLQRRPARRSRQARSLAGQGAPDAAQLDRQVGRHARPLSLRRRGAERLLGDRGLHHAPRHAVRRELHGDLARPPDRDCARRGRPRAEAVHRPVPPHRHQRRGNRDRREDGLRHRPVGEASVPRRPHAAGLCRQLRSDGLRHRRHLRLPGARPARLRFRQQVRPAHHPGGGAARCVR